MLILVVGFISILLATFGVVLVMTGQSPREQTIAQRMALIHIPAKQGDVATAAAAQLLKTTRSNKFGWLEDILERYQFARTLQMHILQAHSLTTVATSNPEQSKYVHCRILHGVAVCTDDSDRLGRRDSTGLAALWNSFLESWAKNQRLQRRARGVH
jgi:hypothetical protein